MNIDRNISRVLAAAAASSGLALLPVPAFAVTQLVCAPGSFQANADSSGNITVTCTEKSGTGGGDTTTPPPPPPPPPPPSGGAIACEGYSKTLVYDLPWLSKSSQITTGFANNVIVVARFTTGPGAPGSLYPANISSIEYGDPRTPRTASLSMSPCDLTGSGLGSTAVAITQGPNWTYQIGGTAPVTAFKSMQRVVLQPSTTYYLNITNKNALGGSTCTTSTCNMIIQLTKPTGT